MDKNAIWKWLVLIGLICFSVWTVTPPFGPTGKVKLGLDLKGGLSFTVRVDDEQLREEIKARGEAQTPEEVDKEVKKALEGSQARVLETLRNRIDNLGIAEPVIYAGKDNRIIVQLPGVDERKRKEAEKSITSAAFLEFRLVHEKSHELVNKVLDEGKVPEGYRPTRIGNETLLVRDRKAVADADMDYAFRRKLGTFGIPSPSYEFMLEKEEMNGQTVYRPYFVERRRAGGLTGESLVNAYVDYQAMGQPVVKIEFDAKGGKKFANLTGNYAPGGERNPDPNKMRQLAIVLDGTLYSAPSIREAIYGGKAEITGQFTVQEATFLSNVLRAGALPAPVRIMESRSVEPSLGKDSIDSGLRSIAYGGIGVLAFMALYYLGSGLVANVALVIMIVLTPLAMIVTAGFLSLGLREAAGGGPIQLPVVTLPGLAGIALSLGMAVDANVLIFERIREELAQGKRLWSAILAGYDRAFSAIFDSNLTTLITGIILFRFGTGPIRGYAVTLCAGIIVSMYTAIVVTKMIFALFASRDQVKTLKMLQVVKQPKIDFLRWKYIAATISVGVILVTAGLGIYKGSRNASEIFGVDFTGGSSVLFSFEQKQPVESVRDTLTSAGLTDLHIQYQKEIEQGGQEFLQVNVGNDPNLKAPAADLVQAAVTNGFPTAVFKAVQTDTVGAQIGQELKKSAVWSIVLGLLGIIIYLSIRFEFGFALGAVVAVFHDVLFTAGVFVALGGQFSLPVIAALLTIVGFSVNDTIVIFDRIREDLKLMRSESFKDLCNLAVNQCMSRTILTSFTVMITVAMLLFFGGGSIQDFALTMFIGLIVGTYSTIYIATPVVLAWYGGRKPAFATKAQ